MILLCIACFLAGAALGFIGAIVALLRGASYFILGKDDMPKERHNYAIVIGLLVLVSLGANFALTRQAYHRGELAGAEAERAIARQAALDANAAYQRSLDSLGAEAAQRIAAADSSAAVALQRSRVARAKADSLRKRIEITSPSTVSVDRGPEKDVDPVIVSALVNADIRAQLDSQSIAGLKKSLADRDGLLRVQSLSIKNLVERDSIRTEQVEDLREEARQSSRRSFWKGLKIGAGVTAFLGALAVILEE